MILHWYLAPLPNCFKVALPDTAPSSLLAEGWKASRQKGEGAYFATARRGLSGESRPKSSSCSTPLPLPKDFCHIYKYINTLHTMASLGGSLPTEAPLTQVHVSGILGKGTGLPEWGSMCSAQGKPHPIPPLFRVQFVQYGELP